MAHPANTIVIVTWAPGELAELKAREARLEAELQRRQLERRSRQEQRSQRREELLEEVAQQEASSMGDEFRMNPLKGLSFAE